MSETLLDAAERYEAIDLAFQVVKITNGTWNVEN
jgi:hypothetical protein